MAVSRVNLLNRTCFSSGFYRIRDLANAASNGGLETLGISDDFFITPLSKECRNKKDFERLFLKDIYQQNQYIQQTRLDFPNLEICFGGVIDLPFNYLHLPLLPSLSGRFQYLLFKNVDQNNINSLIEYSRKFQCPIGLCQNNLKMSFPKFSIDRLVQLFSQNKIFIELDTRVPHFLENGKFFSRLRNTPARLTIGTDTHQDLAEVCQIQIAIDYIERFGLENNLLQIHPPRSTDRHHSGQSYYRRNTSNTNYTNHSSNTNYSSNTNHSNNTNYSNSSGSSSHSNRNQQRNTNYRPKEYNRNNRYYSRPQQPTLQENSLSSEEQDVLAKESIPSTPPDSFPKIAPLQEENKQRDKNSKISYEYDSRPNNRYRNNNKSIRHYSRNYHRRDSNPRFSEEKEGAKFANQNPQPPPTSTEGNPS